MAVTPQSSDPFFREVDDELRRAQLTSFWERYGIAVIVAIVVALLALGGYLFWQYRQTEQAGARGEEIAKAYDALNAGNEPAATKALQPLTKADQPGYRASALMAQAAIAAGKDEKAAAKQFAAIAADESLPKPYRDAALIRQTALEFDGMKPQAIVDRLKPLAQKGDPWFGSAGEMTALAYMKMGKPDLAGALFAAIAQDENVPQSIRTRAVQMASSMGQNTPDIATEAK